MAFGRGIDFHDASPQATYLDHCTGNIVWLYVDDDDAYLEAGIPAQENRAERDRIAAQSDRHPLFPGLDHGEHHDILRQFLHSEWTERAIRRPRAADVYSGSIGSW